MIKSFKNFINQKESILSFPSSFREIKEKILSWDSSHKEQRDKKNDVKNIKEDVSSTKEEKPFGLPEYKDKSHLTLNARRYNGAIHDHPDVRPQNLEHHEKVAIGHYCSTPSDSNNGHSSSANMNGYLRNRLGDKKSGIAFQKSYGHTEDKVKDSIKKLSAAFRPENTNRKRINTYGGVPRHIGEALENSKPRSKHTLAGFTSTSTSKRTAYNFGSQDISKGQTSHIIKYSVSPGAGLSVVHHSTYAENEVTLHHGAHITYKKTTHHKDEWGNPVHVHHVTVHNTHKPLEEYGEYHHNTDLDNIK